MDDELTIQIERLVEKRSRLRDTVDDVSNRPPLSRSTREGQGSQPPRAPPSAPVGNTGVEKGEKKKKTGDAPVIAGANSSPSGKPPGKPRVMGVETLRDRDMVRISRGPPEESWVEVVRRKRKPATTTPRSQPLPSTRAATDKAGARAPARGEAAPKTKLQRPPGSSAVTLTCPAGRYEAYMRQAKASIKLEDLEITKLNFKTAVTGALALEIPGDKDGSKAGALACRMQALFAGNEEVRMARPIKTAELRIKDLEDSVTAEEVALAVAEVGECRPEDIKAGAVSRAPNGLRSVWIRCPLAAAGKITTAGRIKVGWANARVELLGVRPLQCYKCLMGGMSGRTAPTRRTAVGGATGGVEGHRGVARSVARHPGARSAGTWGSPPTIVRGARRAPLQGGG